MYLGAMHPRFLSLPLPYPSDRESVRNHPLRNTGTYSYHSCTRRTQMTRGAVPAPDSAPIRPLLEHESIYLGIDVGKQQHMAGFVSATLLTRHQRFEACPV